MRHAGINVVVSRKKIEWNLNRLSTLPVPVAFERNRFTPMGIRETAARVDGSAMAHSRSVPMEYDISFLIVSLLCMKLQVDRSSGE